MARKISKKQTRTLNMDFHARGGSSPRGIPRPQKTLQQAFPKAFGIESITDEQLDKLGPLEDKPSFESLLEAEEQKRLARDKDFYKRQHTISHKSARSIKSNKPVIAVASSYGDELFWKRRRWMQLKIAKGTGVPVVPFEFSSLSPAEALPSHTLTKAYQDQIKLDRELDFEIQRQEMIDQGKWDSQAEIERQRQRQIRAAEFRRNFLGEHVEYEQGKTRPVGLTPTKGQISIQEKLSKLSGRIHVGQQLSLYPQTVAEYESSVLFENARKYEQTVFDAHIAQKTNQAAQSFSARQMSLSDWKAPVISQSIEVPSITTNKGINAFQGLMSKLEKVPKWKIGVGAGLGIGLGLMGMNSLRFSGRDDEYNTIPGLRHGGMAQQMRQSTTDFGSGYKKEQERKLNIGEALTAVSIAAGSAVVFRRPDIWMNKPVDEASYIKQFTSLKYKSGDVIFSRNILYDDPFHTAIIGDDNMVYEVYPEPTNAGRAKIARYSVEDFVSGQLKHHQEQGLKYPLYGVGRQKGIAAAQRKIVGQSVREMYERYVAGTYNPAYGLAANKGPNLINCLSFTSEAYKQVGKDIFKPKTQYALPWNLSFDGFRWLTRGPEKVPPTTRKLGIGIAALNIGVGLYEQDASLLTTGAISLGLSTIGSRLLSNNPFTKIMPLTGIMLPTALKKHYKTAMAFAGATLLGAPPIYHLLNKTGKDPELKKARNSLIPALPLLAAGYLGYEGAKAFTAGPTYDPKSKRLLIQTEGLGAGAQGHQVPAIATKQWLEKHGWEADIIHGLDDLSRMGRKKRSYRAFLDTGYLTRWTPGLPGIIAQWDVQTEKEYGRGMFRTHIRPGLGIGSKGLVFVTPSDEVAAGFAAHTKQKNFFGLNNLIPRVEVLRDIRAVKMQMKAGKLNLPGVSLSEPFVTISGGGKGFGVPEAVRLLSESKWLEDNRRKAVVFAGNLRSARPTEFKAMMEMVSKSPDLFKVFELGLKDSPARRLPEYMAAAEANILVAGAATAAEATVAGKPWMGLRGAGIPDWSHFETHPEFVRKRYGAVTTLASLIRLDEQTGEHAAKFRQTLESLLDEGRRTPPRHLLEQEFDVAPRLIEIIEEGERRGMLKPTRIRGGISGLLMPLWGSPSFKRALGLVGVSAGVAAIWNLVSNKPKNSIPGRDDAYNTIEGIHPGAGSKSMGRPMIKEDTDFGTGFFMDIVKGSKGAISVNKVTVKRRLLSWLRSNQVNLVTRESQIKEWERLRRIEETSLMGSYEAAQYGKSISSPMRITGPRMFFRQIKSAFSRGVQGVARPLSAVKEHSIFVRRKLYQENMGYVAGSPLTQTQANTLAENAIFHEASEAYWAETISRLAKKRGVPQKELERVMGAGTHWSIGVVADELLYAAKAGPLHYAAARTSRLQEILKAGMGDIDPAYGYHTLRMMQSIEKKWLPRFGYSERHLSEFAKVWKQEGMEEGLAILRANARKEAAKRKAWEAAHGAPPTKAELKKIERELKKIELFESRLRAWSRMNPGKPVPRNPNFIDPRTGEYPEIVSLVPVENAPVNPQPGALHPQGELSKEENQAAIRIHGTTLFGSKWDRMKSISKLLGLELDDVLASKAFHEALAQGSLVQELGSGQFAQASLMKTMFGGEELYYVKKVSSPDARESLKKIIRGHFETDIRGAEQVLKAKMGYVPEKADELLAAGPDSFVRRHLLQLRRDAIKNYKKYASGFNLSHEAQMMREVGHEGIVPTLYGQSDDVLYQEAAGFYDESTKQFRLAETFKSFYNQQQRMPSSAMDEVITQARTNLQRGIVNVDMQGSNLLHDLPSGRTWSIDYGVARSVRPQFNQQRLEEDLSDMVDRLKKQRIYFSQPPSQPKFDVADVVPRKKIPPIVPQLPDSTQLRAIKAGQLSGLQRAAQAQIWSNAQKAGSGHKSAYARRVRQSRNPGDRR